MDPQLVDAYVTAWDAYDVAVSGRRAFIADGYPGIIEVTVADCLGLFADGFESGDTSAWSGVLP
jgi:hypothetical protein